MGVEKLLKLIEEKCKEPGCITTYPNTDSFFRDKKNETMTVDTATLLYVYGYRNLSQWAQQLGDFHHDFSSVLDLWKRAHWHQVNLIYILENTPPDLKTEHVGKKRKKYRNEVIQDLNRDLDEIMVDTPVYTEKDIHQRVNKIQQWMQVPEPMHIQDVDMKEVDPLLDHCSHDLTPLYESIPSHISFDVPMVIESVPRPVPCEKHWKLFEQVCKKIPRVLKIDSTHYQDVSQLLEYHKIPHGWSLEKMDAEKYCALLCRQGLADYVISSDSDALIFGAPHLVTNILSKPKVYCLSKILKSLNMTQEELINLAVLAGCDYCNKIPGIGIITAYNIVKRYGTVQAYLKSMEGGKHRNHAKQYCKFQEAMDEFRSIPDTYLPIYHLKNP